MKKKLKMIIAAAIIIGIGGVTAVMPAFADSGINSSGNMLFEDGDAAFYSTDIEDLQTQVNTLSEGLSEAAYVPAKGEALKDGIKSKGVINYDAGKVIFDASDLFKLADGIDNLDMGYKCEAVNALSLINTFLKQDGTILHEKTDETVLPENAAKLTFSQICEGILKSQSVEHLAARDILPASEDNLSAGCAAWVDGTLLIGNGKDNEDSYIKGCEDGKVTACYYLGIVTSSDGYGERCIDIASMVPEIDYTRLSSDNFILVPCHIYGNSAIDIKRQVASSEVTAYCRIDDYDLYPYKSYNPNTGYLYVGGTVMYIEGGLCYEGNPRAIAESSIQYCAYLVVGKIENVGS